jgi:dienelactone hydrolase
LDSHLCAATVQDQYLIRPKAIKKEISFVAEDGWRIFGTLTLPERRNEGQKIPAALLVHGGEHDQSVFDTYPGWVKIQDSIATLRIDWRGRGKSRDSLESHSFASEQREQIDLDVKAALALLEAQPTVDAERIGIVAEESAAGAAVLGAAGDPHVKVMVFLSGRLGEKAKDYLAANSQITTLGVVSTEDKPSLADMTDIYARSKNPASEIRVFENAGVGAAMGSVWRDRFPNQTPIDIVLGEWFVARLKELGEHREITLQSPDGYTLHADRILPDGASPEHQAPGAVLLHSALGDRSIFESLGRSLVKSGIAVLSLDWRGRGQSIEKGYYFDLPTAEREKVPLDVRAAVDNLASQPAVDGNRIGLVALVLSAKYGMIAAASDPRIKTLVVLTGFVPSEAERPIVNSLKVPVLYLLSEGRTRATKAMMEHFALTQKFGSQVFLHGGGAHGFHLLEMDASWEPLIVRWVSDRLSAN